MFLACSYIFGNLSLNVQKNQCMQMRPIHQITTFCFENHPVNDVAQPSDRPPPSYLAVEKPFDAENANRKSGAFSAISGGRRQPRFRVPLPPEVPYTQAKFQLNRISLWRATAVQKQKRSTTTTTRSKKLLTDRQTD